MARIPKIPGGLPEVTELPLETPNTAGLDKGLLAPTEPPRPLGATGPQYNRTSFQGPAQPAGIRQGNVYSPANPLPAPPGAPQTPVANALAAEARSTGVRGAGEAAGGFVKNAGVQAGGVIRQAGAQTAKAVAGNANAILSGAVATAAHGNAYFDPNVPISDKIRMGATDLAAGTGAALGTTFGAGFGSALLPVAGTVAGGAAGAALGLKGGHAAGDFLFGGDAALERNGYSAKRNIIDVGGDLLRGKGGASFGERNFGGRGAGFTDPRLEGGGQDSGAQPSSVVQPVGQRAEVLTPSGGPQPTPTGNSSPDGSAGKPLPLPDTATHAEVMQAARENDRWNGNNPGFSGIRDSDTEARNAGWDRNRAMYLAEHSRMSPAARATMIGNIVNDGTQERMAALRESGLREQSGQALAIAKLHDATLRRSNDQNNETTKRGQDTSLMGHRMANDVAVANQRREQFNADRTFTAGRADAGNAQDAAAFARRESATKDLHSEIANMLPPGADGKPDMAAAAVHAQALNAHVADRQRALEIEVQKNPGNTAAASELAGINTNGVGALDSVAKRRFVAGMQAKQLADANHSAINPFGGTASNSAAPPTSLRLKSGVISDDYETLDANGKVTGTIPRRAVDRPGSFLGLGGRNDTSYDILKQR
jgi:hypothetical protein